MLKLLIVDDNPLEHLITEIMVRESKIFEHISHSMEADVAIADLERNINKPDALPDVIFLDLSMPVFNGWDFIDKFEELHPQLKKPIDIYIVSSSIDTGDIFRAGKYNFVKAYFTKPLKKETLTNLYTVYHPEG